MSRKLIILGAVVVAGVAMGGWSLVSFLSKPLGGLATPVPFEGKRHSIERVAPDGTRYTVDSRDAIYRLTTSAEDEHSQHIFTNYASALRYAREHHLPSIPSVSLVQTTCRAADEQFQIALERALFDDPQTGRRVLLARWLDDLVARRQLAPPANRPAYDRACRYVAQAITLGGGSPAFPTDLRSDPAFNQAAADSPLGPWGMDDRLVAIWKCDRFLASGLVVTDDSSAAAAAVLARSLAADPVLSAGWERQARIAKVLVGLPSGTTLESLAEVLRDIPDDEITGATACGRVRAAMPTGPLAGEKQQVSPAVVSWAMPPEERALQPLRMTAWDDPMGKLVQAIRSGILSLEPGPEAGFYQRRWYAMETLAAPTKAPETRKLQLSGDYVERWQRAFAAAFSEGRSSFLKRLPELTLGSESEPDNPVPVEVAPSFTAEPAAVVYLRMARAYRFIATQMEAALGREPWHELREANGRSIADVVDQRANALLGLSLRVYRELGFPAPLQPGEEPPHPEEFMAAAEKWCAAIEADSGAIADARLLVNLLNDGNGLHRYPAIIGVRLEPVQYDWIEKPRIEGNVKARFVPVRYWLASPCPIVLTSPTIPTLAEFRARCSGDDTVAGLYASFGKRAPEIHHRNFKWLIRSAVVFLLGVAVWFCFTLVLRRLRRLPRGQVWRIGLATFALLVALMAGAIFAPPVWLLRGVAVHILPVHENISAVGQMFFHRWSAGREIRLLVGLMQDPNPQTRYLAGWLWTETKHEAMSSSQEGVIRRAVNDDIPEVGNCAWIVLCEKPAEIPWLLPRVDKCDEAGVFVRRLLVLAMENEKDPRVIGKTLELTGSPRADFRAAALRVLFGHYAELPEAAEKLRAAAGDPSPVVRSMVALGFGEHGGESDLPLLLTLWHDPDPTVRQSAYDAVKSLVQKAGIYSNVSTNLSWKDPRIQAALILYNSLTNQPSR